MAVNAASVLLLLASMCVTASATCEIPIRRSSVLSSWQSSFGDGDTCFYSRSSGSESTELTGEFSYRFFHSAGSSFADCGFHWFAVQLNESVLISSVTVKGRLENAAHDCQKELINKGSTGIEIWTSNSSRTIFSGQHCSAQNMSREFSESGDSWRLCGVTKSKNATVSSGEIFTVNCVAQVRHLLLRKNVTVMKANDPYEGHVYMSFADLRLQTIQLTSSAPQYVARNSSFTVSCSLHHCNGSQLSTNSTPMQLCFPNGSCWSQHKMEIHSARPQDAGNFICKLGSVEHRTAVTVLYPPSSVSISLMNEAICEKSSDQLVMFTSSASNPAAKHRCTLDTGGCRVLNLTLMSQSTSGHASVSWWTLDLDEEWKLERSHGLIECRAVQNLPAGMKFESELTDRARWSCSDEVESGSGNIPIVLVFTAGIGCASVMIIIIHCVLTLSGFIKWNLHRPRCSCCHAVAMPDSHDVTQVAMVRRSSKTGGAAVSVGSGTVTDCTEYDNANADLGTNCGVYVLQ